MSRPAVVGWWLFAVHVVLAAVVVYAFLFLLSVTTYKKYISPEARVVRRENSRGSISSMKRKKNQGVDLMNISVLVCAILYSINLTLPIVIILDTSAVSCHTFIHVAAPLYQMTKGIMYTLFISRIHTVYGQTQWAYNERYLTLFVVVVNVVNMIVVVGDTFAPKASRARINSEMHRCTANFPTWLVLLAIPLDVIASLLCLYMFTNPLKSMIKMRSSKSQRNVQSAVKQRTRLTRLAMKYTILTWIAVISTLINLVILVIATEPYFGAIDTVINLVCFTLMTNWYDEWYYKYCSCSFELVRCCYSKRDVRLNKFLDKITMRPPENDSADSPFSPTSKSSSMSSNTTNPNNKYGGSKNNSGGNTTTESDMIVKKNESVQDLMGDTIKNNSNNNNNSFQDDTAISENTQVLNGSSITAVGAMDLVVNGDDAIDAKDEAEVVGSDDDGDGDPVSTNTEITQIEDTRSVSTEQIVVS